jgi:protein-disulfide isomerase
MTLSDPVTRRDHIKGEGTGGVTLVEYGDYECSYCAPIIGQIQADFGERLRYVFRHFPLTEIHPQAESAAEVAEFAGAHEKFWEMHDMLFSNQADLGLALYLALGKSLGLPERGIRVSLEEGVYAPKINQDFQGGERSGVDGTPAFFINGRRHDGSYEYADLRSAIEVHLT